MQKIIKIMAAVFLLFLMYVLAPNPSMLVHANSATNDESLTGIINQMTNNFEMLFELYETLEVLSVEERNSVGRSIMVSLQGMQVVRQQVQAMSEGRQFSRDARIRRELNHAISSGIEGKGLVGFIHGQRNPPQSELQIGFAGNGGDHGCGPISTHNMLYALFASGIIDEAPCIANIIHRLDISGGFMMGGEFGTNPEAINQLLRNMGHKVIISYLPTNLDEAIIQSVAGVAILLYINQAGPGRPAYWHYITIRYASGIFELYNVGGHDITKRTTSSVDEWAIGKATLALITIN